VASDVDLGASGVPAATERCHGAALSVWTSDGVEGGSPAVLGAAVVEHVTGCHDSVVSVAWDLEGTGVERVDERLSSLTSGGD
jgi:hypothetical protein